MHRRTQIPGGTGSANASKTPSPTSRLSSESGCGFVKAPSGLNSPFVLQTPKRIWANISRNHWNRTPCASGQPSALAARDGFRGGASDSNTPCARRITRFRRYLSRRSYAPGILQTFGGTCGTNAWNHLESDPLNTWPTRPETAFAAERSTQTRIFKSQHKSRMVATRPNASLPPHATAHHSASMQLFATGSTP